MPEQRCRLCREKKPYQAFPPASNKSYVRGPSCIECLEERKARRSVKERARLLKRRCLEMGGYERLLLLQDGRCAICRRFPSEIGMPASVPKALAVDHDHATGDIRGLLCSNCNIGLGLFYDNPQTLVRAAAYLRRSEQVVRVPRYQKQGKDIRQLSLLERVM